MIKTKNILFIITIMLMTMNVSLAADFLPNAGTAFDYITDPDPNSEINFYGSGITPVFTNKPKIIRTERKSFFSKFQFGSKKNQNKDVIYPDVIENENYTGTDEKQVEEEIKEKNTDKKDSQKEKQSKFNVTDSTVNIYCDNMEYDNENKEVIGTGNAKVVFVENNSIIMAKKIIYNHDLNYIEGIDDVKIIRDGNEMDGDYSKIDLNYGNVMVDKPIIDNYIIKVVAKSGNMTTDDLEAFDGVAYSKENLERRIYSSQHAGFFPMEVNSDIYRKFYPKEYRNRQTKYHIKTKELYVNSQEGNDNLTLKNADVYYGKILLFKGANLSLSSDKTQSYVETTIPEMGSMNYVGAYIGPGFLINTPKSSTLKLVPMLTYDENKLGIGIMGRFRHKRNWTEVIYSTAANKLVFRGRQQFGDSDLFLEYNRYSHTNDWFVGSSISKYNIQLAYEKRYYFSDLGMSIMHRATGGYLTDIDGNNGVGRFRYQAQYSKNLASYQNYDKKFYAALDIVTQGMMSLYTTGDSVGLFRIGPSIRTQYKGWGQNISYFQSAAGGHSPLRTTDDYHYGNNTLQIIESLRLNKYLALGFFGVINLDNSGGYNPYSSNMFSEARFMISVGPENGKLSFGYDTIRQATMLNYTALIGSKNQDISFKKLFIKDPSNLGKEPKQFKWWFVNDKKTPDQIKAKESEEKTNIDSWGDLIYTNDNLSN